MPPHYSHYFVLVLSLVSCLFLRIHATQANNSVRHAFTLHPCARFTPSVLFCYGAYSFSAHVSCGSKVHQCDTLVKTYDMQMPQRCHLCRNIVSASWLLKRFYINRTSFPLYMSHRVSYITHHVPLHSNALCLKKP